MTGYCFFVTRNGERQPVDIDEMTDQELAVLGEKLSEQPTFASGLATSLAKWIRDSVLVLKETEDGTVQQTNPGGT